MKIKMNGFIVRGLITTVILLMVPVFLTAMGNSEKLYPEVLEAEFTDIAEALEKGSIDMDEALGQLHTLRTEYNRVNNEDYQAMEGLLVAVQIRTMEKEQALVQLRQLNECKDEGAELKTQEQLKVMTQSKSQTSTQTQNQTNKPSVIGNDSGKYTGKSSDKAKGKE